MIEKLIEFAKQAGDVQLRMRREKDLEINYKNGQLVSMVTKTDLKISKMFKEFAAVEFSGLNYFIVDEESFAEYGVEVFSKIKDCEYLFVLDPLDGTLQYSQNIPIFGLSLGVFKNGYPYAGVIYMPALREMVYATEEKQAYWLKHAFMPEQHKIYLRPGFETHSALIVDLQQHFSLNQDKNEEGYLFVDYLCSVFSYILIATSRVRSGMFKDWFWDMAGAWAIFDAVGYKIYDFKNKKYLEKFEDKDFTPQLKFKNAHIIGAEEEIEYLENMIIEDLEKP